MNSAEKYRIMSKRQMPSVDPRLIDNLLPVDIALPGNPHLAQMGGWCMAIGCASRLFVEHEEGIFSVFESGSSESDDVLLYEGASFDDAWAALDPDHPRILRGEVP